MRVWRFDEQIRYYDTQSHKENCQADALRVGKTSSEWYREATREKLAREGKERERDFRLGHRPY